MNKKSTLNKISDKIQETLFGLAVTAFACGYAIKMIVTKRHA